MRHAHHNIDLCYWYILILWLIFLHLQQPLEIDSTINLQYDSVWWLQTFSQFILSATEYGYFRSLCKFMQFIFHEVVPYLLVYKSNF